MWVKVQARGLLRSITTHLATIGMQFLKRKHAPHAIKTVIKVEIVQQGMTMEINPQKAINYIMENAPKYAEAKANRVFIENYLRTVKSRLMNEEAGTLGNKEAYAYAHPDYIQQLEALKIATKEEEHLKYMLKAAELRVEVFKVQEYTKRAELKNLG